MTDIGIGIKSSLEILLYLKKVLHRGVVNSRIYDITYEIKKRPKYVTHSLIFFKTRLQPPPP